jgi:hypothetical protein
VAVGKHGVHGVRAVEDAPEDRQRQAGDAQEARLALIANPLQGGQRLLDDLVERPELDVVALEEVDVPTPSRARLSSTLAATRRAEKSKSSAP